MLWPTATILLSADFIFLWLPLLVRGFRPVLARDWHDHRMHQGFRDQRNSVKSRLTVHLLKAPGHNAVQK
jgi:hypothetical protein